MTAATMTTNELTRYVEHVWNLPISLALRGRHASDAEGHRAWHALMAELRDVDLTFSTYREDSTVSRLSRGELSVEECPDEVREIIRLGERAEEESDGSFSIWRPAGDGTLTFDPTGVVKGWAVERAARHLHALDDTDFCLSAGGDIVCRTLDTATAPWRVGIEDPHDSSRIVAVIPIRTGGVATSGAAHRGEHVVDARTNRPPAGIASVTVITDSLMWADIDATAAYARGTDAARWLRTRAGRAGLVVWADGSTEIIDPNG